MNITDDMREKEPVGVPWQQWVRDIICSEAKMRTLQIGEVEKRVDLARDSLNIRLESMNEFRAQISNERGEYVRKDWFERVHNSLEGRVHLLEDFKSNIDGRLLMIGGVITLLNLVLLGLGLWIHK